MKMIFVEAARGSSRQTKTKSSAAGAAGAESRKSSCLVLSQHLIRGGVIWSGSFVTLYDSIFFKIKNLHSPKTIVTGPFLWLQALEYETFLWRTLISLPDCFYFK